MEKPSQQKGGAREKTNNTGGLSAIAEAMLWLLHECPHDGHLPALIRYDSKYAASILRSIWDPSSNEELMEKTRALVEEVCEKSVIVWQHVFSHTGIHDDELADEAADRGTQGLVSRDSRRWSEPPPPVLELDKLQ